MYRTFTGILIVLATFANPGRPPVAVSWEQTAPDSAAIGTLSGYDPKTRILTIKCQKTDQAFVLAAKASVRLGAEVLSDDEIVKQTGKRVKVRYTEAGGKRLAHSVMISRNP